MSWCLSTTLGRPKHVEKIKKNVHLSWKNFELFTFFQSICVNCVLLFLVVVRNFYGFEFNRGINLNV